MRLPMRRARMEDMPREQIAPPRWPLRLGLVAAVCWPLALLAATAVALDQTRWPWLVGLGLVLIGGTFVATIGLVLRHPGEALRPPWALIALQAVLTAAVLLVPGVVVGTLPFLLAISIGAVLERRWAIWLVVAVAVASGVAVHAHGDDWSTALLGTCLNTLLAGWLTMAFTWLGRVIQELQCTREELAELAVRAERNRFARDLHDLLGHSLSVIVVKAQAVRRTVTDQPDLAVRHAEDIERVGRRALDDVRAAVHGYRNPTFDEALDGACETLRAAGIETRVVQGSDSPDARQGELLGWVLREGATNVLRHGHAQHVEIRTRPSSTPGTIELSIENDVDSASDTADDGHDGVGLQGLRDRLTAAGGDLSVHHDTSAFRLTALLPASPGGDPCRPAL